MLRMGAPELAISKFYLVMTAVPASKRELDIFSACDADRAIGRLLKPRYNQGKQRRRKLTIGFEKPQRRVESPGCQDQAYPLALEIGQS